MKTNTISVVLLSTLTLVGCVGTSKDTLPSHISLAARKGALWSHELLMTGTIAPRPPLRPSALLGPYVAAFLSQPFVHPSHAAVTGVLAGTSMLFEEGVRNESYALLEELGLVLQVSVPEMLNRSINRTLALDTYREGLVESANRGQEHLVILHERLDEANAEVREIRRRASELQRALNAALRAKDYATASALQSQVSEAQGQQAVSTAAQKEIRSIIELFEDSLQTAADRLVAIDANREALIAGVSVTDLPGTDDLGVLEEGSRTQRRANPEDIFGPTGQ